MTKDTPGGPTLGAATDGGVPHINDIESAHSEGERVDCLWSLVELQNDLEATAIEATEALSAVPEGTDADLAYSIYTALDKPAYTVSVTLDLHLPELEELVFAVIDGAGKHADHETRYARSRLGYELLNHVPPQAVLDWAEANTGAAQ